MEIVVSNIPHVRTRMLAIAEELEAAGLDDYADELRQLEVYTHRRTAARRAPSHSAPVTPARRARIVELAETTDMHSSEIAAEVGVNPGRVSEVLQGDR